MLFDVPLILTVAPTTLSLLGVSVETKVLVTPFSTIVPLAFSGSLKVSMNETTAKFVSERDSQNQSK